MQRGEESAGLSHLPEFAIISMSLVQSFNFFSFALFLIHMKMI